MVYDLKQGPEAVMREIAKQWGAYMGLIAVFVTATASTTYTLNSRMAALERRIELLDGKIEALDQKFDRKFDELDQKFDRKFDELDKKLDQLLLALASRGVVLPAKMDGKQSEAKR